MSDAVENSRWAREKLVIRRRAIVEETASMDRVFIDYATDLTIIQGAIEVSTRLLEKAFSRARPV